MNVAGSAPTRGFDPSEPIWAGAIAALLGLVPFCIPLQFVLFARFGSCGDLWLTAGPLYALLVVGIVVGRRRAPLDSPAISAVPDARGDSLRCIAQAFLVLSGVANIAIGVGAVLATGVADVLSYRDFFERLPAVSLVTQFHVPFLIPFLVLSVRQGRRWHGVMALVFVALLIRAVVLAERLGFIEAVVLSGLGLGLSGVLRVRFRHLAFLGVGGPVLWIGTELTRNFYRQLGSSVGFEPTLAWFAVRWLAERFTTYYADVANKLLFAVHSMSPALRPDAFYGLIQHGAALFGIQTQHVPAVTELGMMTLGGGFGWGEMNNPGGLTTWYLDWGLPGTAIALIALGVITGRAFLAAQAGHPLALMLYGGLIVGVMETPRIFYFGAERYLVPTVLGLFALLALGRSPRNVEERRPQPVTGAAEAFDG